MAIMQTISTVSSAHFDYLPHERQFLAFASDLQGSFKLGRIFDDACDEGFKIRSAKTGKTEIFVLTEILKDQEGDIQGWVFKALNRTLNVSVTIFND